MKKFFIPLFLVLAMISCDDYLTRDNPTSTINKEWWETQGQIDNALNTIYNGISNNALPKGASTNGFDTNNRNAFSALTDNAYWNNNFYGSINTFAQGDGTPSTGVSGGAYGYTILSIWDSNYNQIRLANRFINNAGKAYVDGDLKKRYIGEARALRAWFHLELFLYFKNIAIVRSAVDAQGAREMTNTNTTPDQIVEFITTQLDSAAAVLPYSYSSNENWRITKGATYAMKAVAYLNNRDYEKAAQSAKRVIDLEDNTGNKMYGLWESNSQKTNYASLFSYDANDQNKERIFDNNGGLGSIWKRNAPAGITPGGTQAGVNPTASLVNTYETKQGKTLDQLGPDSAEIYKKNPNYHNNRDPRFKATILYPVQTAFGRKLQPFDDDPNNPDRISVSTGTATGFWVRKYLTEHDRYLGWGGSDLNYNIIRYAQILLIRVEALVESGDWQNPDVIKNLNKIRERAGMPDVDRSTYNSQEKLRELYQRERRVELALEGWRWFDIRRWEIANKVMNVQVHGAIDPSTGNPLNVVSRNYNLKDALLPIPRTDIQSSRLQQNPGY